MQLAVDGIDGGARSRWSIKERGIHPCGPVRAGGLSGIDVARNVFIGPGELDLLVDAIRTAIRDGV